MTCAIIYLVGVTFFSFLTALGAVDELIHKKKVTRTMFFQAAIVTALWPVVILILLIAWAEGDTEGFRLLGQAFKELYDTARGKR